MKQLVVTGPSEMWMQDTGLPELAAGHALCRVEYVGLCGVDLSLWKGYSTYIQEGLSPYPFVLGHEWVGICIGVAPDVSDKLIGVNVAGHNFIVCGTCSACRSNRQENCVSRSEMGIHGRYPGALSEYVSVPASVLTPIPDAMSLRTAALLEPAATALHALRRTGVTASDRVLILGTGTVGLSVLLLAKALGAEATVAGIDEAGLEFARQLGADQTCHTDAIASDRYTVVVEASGAPAAVARIPDALAPGGRVALVGVPNNLVDGLMVSTLVMKNVRIDAIYSGIHEWEELVTLVERHHINLGALIDEVHPFLDYGAAFAALARPGKSRPKTLIRVGAGIDLESPRGPSTAAISGQQNPGER
jgi:2-desacetyl-2-hydroxyethyl bacteriochlorophyllide A dehydrogenase